MPIFLAFMKLNKNEEALNDCNKSLELNEKYVKVRESTFSKSKKMSFFDSHI